MYDGSLDEESPVHGSAVSFKIGDYLHIFEKFEAIAMLVNMCIYFVNKIDTIYQ